jgi:hypothetical protein
MQIGGRQAGLIAPDSLRPYPCETRYLLAHDPEPLREIRSMLMQKISTFLRRRARQQGIVEPRPGAVAFLQRLDSVAPSRPPPQPALLLA